MGQKERKERERQVRREDILDAVEKVFFDKGFEGATIDDICKEAQYTRRTIYQYFTGKEEMYDAILLRAFRTLNACLQEIKDNNDTGIEQIAAMAKAFMRFTQEKPGYSAVVNTYRNWDKEIEEKDIIRKMSYEEGEVSFNLLVNAIRKGVADGSIRSDIDVVGISFMLYANLIGLSHLVLFKEKYILDHYCKPVEMLFDESIRLTLGSISTNKVNIG